MKLFDFARAVETGKKSYYLSNDISIAIATVIEKFGKREYRVLGDKL